MPATSVRLDGTRYELARTSPAAADATGPRPAYEEFLARSVAPRIATGQQGYANLPPDQGTVLDFSDWAGGFGFSDQRTGTYAYGENVDARTPGEVKIAPRIRELTGQGSGPVTGFFERDDQLFTMAGQHVAKLAESGSTPLFSAGNLVSERDFGSGHTVQGATTFQGPGQPEVTYVADTLVGQPNPFYMYDGDAWTQAPKDDRANPVAVFRGDTTMSDALPTTGWQERTFQTFAGYWIRVSWSGNITNDISVHLGDAVGSDLLPTLQDGTETVAIVTGLVMNKDESGGVDVIRQANGTINLGAMTTSKALFIAGAAPFDRWNVDLVGGTINNAEGPTVTVEYWNGNTWEAITGVDDDTIVAGGGNVFPMRKDGAISWDSLAGEAGAAITTAPHAVSLGSLATTHALYIGNAVPCEGICAVIGEANTATTAVYGEYWNGTAWTALTNEVDNTVSSGVPLAESADIAWDVPTDWGASMLHDHAAYWMRLRWNAALSSGTSLAGINTIQRNTATHFFVLNERLYRVSYDADTWELWQSQAGGLEPDWIRIGTISPIDDPVTAVGVSQGIGWIWCQRSLHALTANTAALAENRSTFAVDDEYHGVGLASWGGNTWAPTDYGLVRTYIDQAVPFFDLRLSPHRLRTNRSRVRGRVTAAAGDAFGLYAAMKLDEGNDSWLLNYDPVTQVWHTLNKLTGITVRAMHVSTVGHAENPVLVLGDQDADLHYLVLPRESANPANDDNCEYHQPTTTDPAQLVLGRVWTPYPQENKYWMQADVLGPSLGASASARLLVVTQEGAAATEVGAFRSPAGEKAALTLQGQFLDLTLDLASTDQASPAPQVSRFLVWYAVRFETRRQFRVAVRLSSTNSDGFLADVGGARTRKSALWKLVGRGATFELETPDGETVDVICTDAQALQTEGTEGLSAEYVFSLELIEPVVSGA